MENKVVFVVEKTEKILSMDNIYMCFDTIVGIYANKDAAEKAAKKMRVEETCGASYGVTVYKLQ